MIQSFGDVIYNARISCGMNRGIGELINNFEGMHSSRCTRLTSTSSDVF